MGIFDRFPYSSTHEMNLDFMLGKATEIAEDMQQVTAGMEQVQAGLTAISEKTEQATQAAAQAAQSASSIEGSVTAAEEAAEEAQMHNESAQTWANNALTYKADCQRAATEAAASSSSAAQAATAASASEDTVAQYAQAANASAQSAANNNDSAHQYANQASASASNATFHSSNAQTAATNANTSATNAETAATNAQTAATRTAALKDDCETLHRMCVAAVDQAATEAVNAGNSAAQAAATKTDVETLVESLPEDFTDLNNTVNQLSDEIDEISTAETVSEIETEYYTTPWTSGGGINANGELISVDTWAYTDKIPVVQGDLITCDRLSGSSQRISANIRYLCAYNGDNPVPSSGYSTEIENYTVPSGITHIVVTLASYPSYTGHRVIITRTDATSKRWIKQNKIGGFIQHGSLNDGEEFVFPVTNIKQYKVFSFDGNITSFSSIKIGRKVDGADNESVVVDSTNITITNTYGTETAVAHNLTIADNLQILLATGKNNRLVSIRIISKGDVFEYTALNNITWNADTGSPFVRSIGSAFTDCTASWTSRKINAPIWIFGDSYLTYDAARWTYYLIEDGYDVNCLLNAYAGENSQNAFTAFNSLMQSGIRPQMVVWALGMNDRDTASDAAPNGNWLNILNKVIETCKGRGVELILCTIPTTPVVNNNYKNAWVKNSRFRYVDFAASVGASTNGNWFEGLLSSDNVHPTAEGAKTLYYKFLSEVPEIVTNN